MRSDMLAAIRLTAVVAATLLVLGGHSSPAQAGSCVGFCGDQSADGCWCDGACVEAGDCCEDACDVCGKCAPVNCDGECVPEDDCLACPGDCGPVCMAPPYGSVEMVCQAMCGTAMQCGIADDFGGEQCVEGCAGKVGWQIGIEHVACIEFAACDGLGQCFAPIPAVTDCDFGCAGIEACGLHNDLGIPDPDVCPELCSGVVAAAGTEGGAFLTCMATALATCDGEAAGACFPGAQGPGVGGCEGFCGGVAPEGCYCDAACVDAGDCCPDVEQVCTGGGGGGSCVGACGGGSDGCYCDPACVQYGDCCDDACDVCGLCDVPPADPCEQICERVSDCFGESVDLPDCLSVCEAEWESEAANLWCAQTADCGDLPACVEPADGHQLCAQMCAHGINCGYSDMPFSLGLEQCEAFCSGQALVPGHETTFACIAETMDSCDELAVMTCISEPAGEPPTPCAAICTRAVECDESVELTDCIDDCKAQGGSQLGDRHAMCASIASCDQLDACASLAADEPLCASVCETIAVSEVVPVLTLPTAMECVESCQAFVIAEGEEFVSFLADLENRLEQCAVDPEKCAISPEIDPSTPYAPPDPPGGPPLAVRSPAPERSEATEGGHLVLDLLGYGEERALDDFIDAAAIARLSILADAFACGHVQGIAHEEATLNDRPFANTIVTLSAELATPIASGPIDFRYSGGVIGEQIFINSASYPGTEIDADACVFLSLVDGDWWLAGDGALRSIVDGRSGVGWLTLETEKLVDLVADIRTVLSGGDQ